jgi:hypothetical protein
VSAAVIVALVLIVDLVVIGAGAWIITRRRRIHG